MSSAEEGIGTLKVYTQTMGGERTSVLEASSYTAGLALAEVDLDFTEPIKVGCFVCLVLCLQHYHINVSPPCLQDDDDDNNNNNNNDVMMMMMMMMMTTTTTVIMMMMMMMMMMLLLLLLLLLLTTTTTTTILIIIMSVFLERLSM